MTRYQAYDVDSRGEIAIAATSRLAAVAELRDRLVEAFSSVAQTTPEGGEVARFTAIEADGEGVERYTIALCEA